jgi:hypothetical protein
MSQDGNRLRKMSHRRKEEKKRRYFRKIQVDGQAWLLDDLNKKWKCRRKVKKIIV